MSSSVRRPEGSGGPGPDGFPAYLEDLRTRLERMRAEDLEMVPTPAEMVSDLETAYEELRVADEEVRSQQEQIAQLVEGYDVLRTQHERMLGMLPVPALVTDVFGRIRHVNSAAAALTAARVERLLGRPAFTVFDPDDRRELRELLASALPSGTAHRAATVLPLDGEPVSVHLSLVVRRGEVNEVTWLLLAARERGQDRSPGLGHGLVPQALVELVGLPGEGGDRQGVLARAADVCSRTLDVPDVSLQLGEPGRPEAVASTSALAQDLDGAQLVAGEGPSVDAFRSRRSATSQDLTHDRRWPRLAEAVPPEPVRALSVPIEVGQRLVGVLNVYDRGTAPTAVAEGAELLAASLGAVFYELELTGEVARLGLDLRRALGTRAEIEQAKGIIMAEHGCGPDEAFVHLTELSSSQERKVRDVARSIVERISSRG